MLDNYVFWQAAVVQNIESSANLNLFSFFLSRFICRGEIKSPWSRRKRKRALSNHRWNRLFSANGKLRDGGRKLLKKVRSGVSICTATIQFFVCAYIVAHIHMFQVICYAHFSPQCCTETILFCFLGNWTRHQRSSLAISTWSVRWLVILFFYIFSTILHHIVSIFSNGKMDLELNKLIWH
jgi:hypothetical protein